MKRLLAILSSAAIMLGGCASFTASAEGSPLALTAVEKAPFVQNNQIKGKCPSQPRIGIGNTTRADELDNVGIGMRFSFSDLDETKFIKNANVILNINQIKPYMAGDTVNGTAITENWVYKTSLYPMTADWSQELGEAQNDKDGNLQGYPWVKDITEYEGYPNIDNMAKIAYCERTATGPRQRLEFSYDVTSDIIIKAQNGIAETAYFVANPRFGNDGGVWWDEYNCLDLSQSDISMNIEYCENDDEISSTVKYISLMGDYGKAYMERILNYFASDSAYFELSEENKEAVYEEIKTAEPQNKDELFEIIKNRLKKIQYETSITDGQKEVSLSTHEIEIKASRNGENKQPVTDGDFTLTDSTGAVVPTTFANSIVSFGNLKDEETYTLSWRNITGLEDSQITFKTTGIYIYLDVNVSKNAMKENETADLTVEGVFSKSKLENELPIEKINVNIEKPETLSYENGKFTALKRGVTDVTFSFTNEDGSTITAKKKIAVYNKSGDGEGEYICANVTAAENTDFYTYKFDKYVHQLVLMKNGEKYDIYLDAEIIGEDTADNALLKADITYADVQKLDISGSICKATFVNARYANGAVEGKYTYEDKDNDPENGTVYVWYISSKKEGAYSPISGETSKTLKVKSSMYDKYVKFEVTPKNIYETGETVISEPVKIYKPADTSSGGSSSGGGGGSSSVSRPSTGTKDTVTIAPPKTDDTKKPENTEKQSFSDVSKNHWAYSFIESLYKDEILNGTGDGKFEPDRYITRAEFVCALIKALKLNTAGADVSFTDVSAGDWFMPYVAKAVAQGFVKGFEDGSFKPNDFVTREQMAVMVSNALQLTDGGETSFSDNADISAWASDSVGKMYRKGYISGSNNEFRPLDSATRAEVSKILSLILNSEVK